MISQMNLAVWAWVESFRDLRRGRLWLPFLLLAGVQALFVLFLTQFHRPGMSWLLAPIVSRVGGAEALHYPQFYLQLPGIFSQANLALDWLVGSLIFGAAFLTIWRSALGLEQGTPLRDAFRRYVSLLGVRLPLVLLLIGLAWLVPALLLPKDVPLEGNQLRLFRYGSFLGGVILETLFVYAPLVLLAESTSIPQALQRSLRLVFRVPLASLLVVAIPNLLQIPTSWILRRADRLVTALTPELVVGLVIGAIAVYIVINYLIVASAVRVYGARGVTVAGGTPWKA